MNFRNLVKTVDTTNFYMKNICPELLKAQYNPERIHLWKSVSASRIDPLNMLFSPHYKFLLNRNDKSYYRLQRLYGRNDKWIKSKIEKFLGVLESIKKNGFIENVVILEKPLVDNQYNNSYEIFEGHHRVACSLFLNLDEIPCEVIRRI